MMRLVYRVMALSVALLLLFINIRLYYPSVDGYGIKKIGPDVLPQLHFIKIKLVEGSGEEMQTLFPEGYFFSYAFYGLSWVNIGLREPYGSELHQEALRDARWALEHLESPAGKAPFSATLTPPYGVFYVGWSTWLRGGILLLQPAEARDPDEMARFQADCIALAEAFEESSTPFLTSYPNRAWPVDSVAGIAALRLHDKLFAPSFQSQSEGIKAGRFAPTIERWIEQAKAHVDPETGLLAHTSDPQTGEPVQGTRGTSQSVISRFLLEIDNEWGHDQYLLFREQFAVSRLGLPGVREYPLGVEGTGDVDSGPLIFDVSLSATVVTLGASLVYGDRWLAEPLLQAGDILGIPIDLPLFPSDSFTGIDTKRYLLGQLPIADGLLVWSKTAYPWIVDPITVLAPPINPFMWREQWAQASRVVIILFVLWSLRREVRQLIGDIHKAVGGTR